MANYRCSVLNLSYYPQNLLSVTALNTCLLQKLLMLLLSHTLATLLDNGTHKSRSS